ncbi:MAG TPA: 5'/3'-nucleotidase SurE [Thiothrix sp.]|nr:5'/3'-nucleotidase SurE [Thiothrix sp.]
MRILLSNDDGYLAPGIRALWDALHTLHDVLLIAPENNQSGVSSALTLKRPLRLTQHDAQIYSVDGTPTDSVHMGLTGLDDNDPDLVLSGINQGANMGDDVIYSGTIAAAIEGRFLGLPALAVSLASWEAKHYDSAVLATKHILSRLVDHPFTERMILNINVPDLPWSDIKGFQVTRLGQRHRSEPVFREKDPRGQPIYWLGPAGEAADAGLGTDFYAVEQGYVSITPIHTDLTYYAMMDKTRHWLEAT